jgi:hypothetical protein
VRSPTQAALLAGASLDAPGLGGSRYVPLRYSATLNATRSTEAWT